MTPSPLTADYEALIAAEQLAIDRLLEAPRTAPCPYCHSPLRVSEEPYPARRLSEAELAELDDTAEAAP